MGRKGEGVRNVFSSLARQRNVRSPTFSISNNNKNFTDTKQLVIVLLFYVSTLFFFKKRKGLKTCVEVTKGMNTWPVCGSLTVLFIAISAGLRSVLPVSHTGVSR